MGLFFSALLVGYSGAMMPGPLLTYTIERSLARGWKVGLLIPLGHVLLEILVVMLLLLGLGGILSHPIAKTAILFAGGVVLLWFAYGMLQGAVRGSIAVAAGGTPASSRGADLEIVYKSAMISALNPYFLIWWATIGLGFLLANEKMGIWGIVLFYLGHSMADFTWYFAVSLLCGKIGRFIGGMAYRVIIAVLGLVLAFFAVLFIIDGIKLI